MKRLALGYAVLIMLALVSSCSKKAGDPQGQLTGVMERPKWDHINPMGMVYIPSGTFYAGPGDEDMNNSLQQRPQAQSIQGFYMDATEITNNEYRQFVNYVRDSIAHTMLDHFIEDDKGQKKIDWAIPIDWSPGSEDVSALGEMYYSGNDKFWGREELDVNKLKFAREWYDWKSAARKDMRENSRGGFIKKEETHIYPDTLCWVHDFSYSYNEPMTRNYFWHPSFDDYPVVGVNWTQANAFCSWRTKLWNEYQQSIGETMGEEFRLPFEHEWEYAARGGKESAPYPWGGPYVRNRKGCLLANFKPGRGNYPEDGGFYTVRADSYHPNDFGLYNMAGNVAEWTSTAFYENSQAFNHDMNADIRYDAGGETPITMKRKVIRGGSWKDVAYYIQTGTRNWEYQDTAKAYIGFRTALTFLGRSIDDKY
ncbi:MAG: SUMF1/EgtB/PvdO family nonheme iron enzyme [Sphingobacteriales bacterium]|nr:SUMF1/EgtB/PvdO family nonheme iron enzyme [Sphingobacteriales bacterium]MCC7222905.1 SUMF1/EgtB/PvdO family nonheme iron enzyme [Chitinophagales bacterium]